MASFTCGPLGQFSLHSSTNSSSKIPEWRIKTKGSESPTSIDASNGTNSSLKPKALEPKAKWEMSNDWRCANKLQGPQKPRFEDLKVGQVLYLRKKPAPKDSILHHCTGVLEGTPWGHPAVVCEKWERNGEHYVDFRLGTSFGGHPLEVSRKQFHWQYYVMADNNVDVVLPNNNTSLATLENGGKFTGRTYINLSPNGRMSIEYKYLEPWGDGSLRFDQESAEKIANAYCYSIDGPRAKPLASPR
ncbi:hypothetical protein IQ07DRAFT_655291 [Pyrenochaeta sp. DS3sAY3a]|nr:hypothetical protein IQ07DRAFT_655291 [Pyrenochaeta sp. DS3sAY3a]